MGSLILLFLEKRKLSMTLWPYMMRVEAIGWLWIYWKGGTIRFALIQLLFKSFIIFNSQIMFLTKIKIIMNNSNDLLFYIRWVTFWRPSSSEAGAIFVTSDGGEIKDCQLLERPFAQPLRDVREYFGEKVALYFAWLGYYTVYLLFPAVLGCFMLILYAVRGMHVYVSMNMLINVWIHLYILCIHINADADLVRR